MILSMADVVDLDHNCIRACCLAHRRPIFTGGIDRDWLHSDRWPCGESNAGGPVMLMPQVRAT